MGIISNFISSLRSRVVYISSASARSRQTPIGLEQQASCRSILDCNSAHVAMAQVLHVVKDDQDRVRAVNRKSPYTRLFERPNPMMSRYDFLYALTWQLQLKNTALAWVEWEGVTPKNIWPIAYRSFEFLELADGGYAVQFTDTDGAQRLLHLEDVVILRRHYDGSGVAGLDNRAADPILDLVNDLDAGLADAVTFSNRIHGILKQRKAMLASSDVEASQKAFRGRMEQAAKTGGGIITLDATEDYTPLSANTWTANAAQLKNVSDRLNAYWRTPPDVVSGTASEQTMQNYYDGIVDPIWEAMGQAFTAALFTAREYGHGNRIMVVGTAAAGASWATRLSIINDSKEMGLLTVNEQRALLNYPPVEDGDVRLISLNYVKSGDQSKYQLGKDTKDEPNTGKEPEQNAIPAE